MLTGLSSVPSETKISGPKKAPLWLWLMRLLTTETLSTQNTAPKSYQAVPLR